MKLIIPENKRGLLYKHGVYKRLLQPGRRYVWPQLGEDCIMLNADGEISVSAMDLAILRKDPEFERSIAVIEVPDNEIALHFVNGRITTVLKPGIYAFWNIYQRNTFDLIAVSDPETARRLPAPYMAYVPSNLHTKFDISDGETGLLFYDGIFQNVLGPGQHFFWKHNTNVTVQTVDTRIQQLEIPGQEILTADKVSLRINFVCTYQVTDPICIVTKLKDYKVQLHVLVQLVLREFAGKLRFDELLRQKDSIGVLILKKLREREEELYVKFSDAGVKDVILPGEIRDIMNTVLVAEKAAQAGVIARREEIAATKSLLDTAKLMDANATLYKLKELEYLERICDKVGSISVDAGGGILKNLRELVSGKPNG